MQFIRIKVRAYTIQHEQWFLNLSFKISTPIDPQSIDILHHKSNQFFNKEQTFQQLPLTFNPLPLDV